MNTAHPSLADALAQADLLYAREALEPVIADMGARIDAVLGGERAVFLTVMNGALIFAGQLALAIRTDLEFDYVHATRYRGETTGSTLHWLRAPAVSLAGRVVLLVDDILDEGHTLEAIIAHLKEEGAAEVLSAVLVHKLHQRKARPGMRADFTGLDIPDRFLFGCGMDYKGYWRNAPGIYAVKGL